MMRRRDFIKKAGFATAGAFAVPYILPTGRLFAASGIRRVDHVVFCLFAGGVRNAESVQKAEGNLMSNILAGTETISPDIAGSMDVLPLSPLGNFKLQQFGTLFKNFKYASGPTGHFNGHTCAVTGQYTDVDLNFKDHPKTPTVFEFYRKYNSPAQSALKSWWVSNTLGPYPALNYSSYPGYGAAYGANFIAPTFLISNQGYDALGNLRTFSSQEEAAMNSMRTFLDHNFNHNFVNGDAGVTNTEADTQILQSFITDLLNNHHANQYVNPWGAGNAMNNDMMNIFFAEKIIQQFQPELLVVNMQDVDVCHFDFTQYCNNLRKADYAVAHLWQTIQNTPGMTDNTVLIVAPEHGRNQYGNSTIDSNGRAALDHTASVDYSGDQAARDIFCLVAGPDHVVHQNSVITSQSGESIEIIPLVANMLGFDSQIPSGMLKDYLNCDIQAAII
jgi:hypothetical protein